MAEGDDIKPNYNTSSMNNEMKSSAGISEKDRNREHYVNTQYYEDRKIKIGEGMLCNESSNNNIGTFPKKVI